MRKSTDSFPLGSPSTSCGEEVFSWIISPIEVSDFLSTYWEKKPLVVKRNSPDYFGGIFSRKSVENILKTDPDFAINSLVLSRSNEVSPGCPGDVETLSTMLGDGWMAQLVQPQQKNAKLHALIERLENYTGSLWGSNFYFTEGVSDSEVTCTSSNVDIFVLQFCGSADWKVYGPEIPLNRNFGDTVDADSLGPPLMDEVLNAGDVLYVPRGAMYSSTPASAGSSHLCLSTYQENGWCDLLSSLTTSTLTQLTESDVSFREGLPFNWTCLFGVGRVETESNKRTEFLAKLKSHLFHLVESSIARIDAITDEMAADFVALRTPPIKRVGPSQGSASFGPDPRLVSGDIRFRNLSWIRLVQEDEDAPHLVLFSCLENQITQHMKSDNPMDAEPTSIDVDRRELEGIQTLLTNWPQWVDVACINRQLAGTLWEHSVLETRESSKKQRK